MYEIINQIIDLRIDYRIIKTIKYLRLINIRNINKEKLKLRIN